MPDLRLTRRASLLLPFLLSACGGGEETFPPLRYNYLPPIRLNVASFSIEQRFYPSGVRPDITGQDPVHPVEALRTMAEDRLQAVGTTGQAVFAITNASLTKVGGVITCGLTVVLEIYPTPGVRSGFAQATVSRQHIGSVDNMPATLYDLTKNAMNALNVEFEYQVQANLQAYLATTTSVQPPVEAQPLQTAPAAPPPPGSLVPPANASPTPLAPNPPMSAPPTSPPPAATPVPTPPPQTPPANPSLPSLPPGFPIGR
ncbi:MAG TPA: hypothetical protein VMB73_00670 [Acetobacteraceae bacterium]|jgi:hypothetical protein|nr:hypothetical protein [Acetobacteraceae bacterium]